MDFSHDSHLPPWIESDHSKRTDKEGMPPLPARRLGDCEAAGAPASAVCKQEPPTYWAGHGGAEARWEDLPTTPQFQGPPPPRARLCSKDLLYTEALWHPWQAPIQQTPRVLRARALPPPCSRRAAGGPWAGQLRGRAGMKVRRRARVLGHHTG